MSTTRADEQACAELEEAAVEAALEALVPLGESGPAWADVLERAAALAPCTCNAGSVDDAGPFNTQTSMPQEATWPLPIRNRSST
jgi:hypothetical protein